jgi:hypothetical protein
MKVSPNLANHERNNIMRGSRRYCLWNCRMEAVPGVDIEDGYWE